MMNSLLEQLRSRRSIPYISKKKINDDLTELVMRCVHFEFYTKLYRAVLRTVATDRFVVVKGGMAIEGLLGRGSQSGDLDVQLIASIDDEPFDIRSVVARFDFNRLYKTLETEVASTYLPVVRTCLESIKFEDLSAATIGTAPMFVMFKSYVNEAIVIARDRFDSIKFRLDEERPLKMTVSEMKDRCYLVRFSFNVNVFARDMYEYRERKRTRSIGFFPLNLYFLDVTVVKQQQHDQEHAFVELFDDRIAVDTPDRVIIDQLECMFFNVFYGNESKINLCYDRIVGLLERFDCEPDLEQTRAYFALVSDRRGAYKANDIKSLMCRVGSRLGVRLVDELFETGRITTELKDITYQINFPYHIWDREYFSNCWHVYLGKTRCLFGYEPNGSAEMEKLK
ncbi:ORF136 [Leucania separata nucleopolyhedrovirus]|uniref:ORF136 n=1 Tax=Leucania separata nucleopolyhedrovirus TaxID=1307956 RepID=Q0IKY3_NPVLS|nr:ORF136 [Leucania separata nucleopolyhedrovirus]AAR28900.1 ORF136 [Leucania separata nucleopolyhedrovirus]